MDEQVASSETPMKRKYCGMWKEGQATWEVYRNVVRACREAKRKAKAYMGLIVLVACGGISADCLKSPVQDFNCTRVFLV